MLFRIFVLSLVVLNFSCTKKQEIKKVDYVEYNSPVKYIFKEIKGDNIAMVGEVPVSRSQLLSQDPALQELQERYNQQVAVFVYAWANMLAEKSPEPIEVQVTGFKPSKEMTDILVTAGVEYSENINLSFDEKESFDVIGRAGDKVVTWQQFLESNMAHSKMYKALFTQRMQRLNGIVIRRLLLDASKKSNTPMEDYVQKNIITQSFEPTLEDVKAFAAEKGISESDLKETLVERLKDIVKQNDRDKKIAEYVGKNLTKDPVYIGFKGAHIVLDSAEVGGDVPHWGQKGPNVVFIGDWSCNGCSDSIKAFLETKRDWQTLTQGSFIYSFPDRDREARMGAEAALCVEAQNKDSFWTFLDKIVDIDEQNLEQRIYAAVDASGVDSKTFKDCFLKRDFQQAVDTHLSYSKNMGVTKAPLLVVQGRVFEPPFDLPLIAQTLKDLGAQTKAPSLWSRIKAFFGL